jgi:hypothetical protein
MKIKYEKIRKHLREKFIQLVIGLQKAEGRK